MDICDFYNNLIVGNSSVITNENIKMINDRAISIYNQESLNKQQIEELELIIESCNILYNRTDMTVLPIEDGFYDLLLEKYKKYDPNFQVGSAIIEFRNFIENDLSSNVKIAESPLIFIKQKEKDEYHQEIFDTIMMKDKSFMSREDFAVCPIEFINQDQYIQKRTHNTEHNHPDLVGTLDKAKFIFINDAVDAGVIDDDNVKILERDFFMDHISKGIYNPNRIISVVCELKYDGISVEADCGFRVESARTRGDTGVGAAADISPILQGYTFKHAKCMENENPIGVKFEAIMTKTNLDKFNQLRERNYKNCRTAIVGLFGSSDAYLYRDLITLIPLAVDRDNCPYISNRLEEIEFLNKLFVSHGEPLRYCFMQGTVQEILYMIKVFHDEALVARDYLNFMYDGIVVSYVDEDIREALGRKNYINKYSMAVKFNPLVKQTIFRGYTYEVGQNGQITPMIHYDPVEFLGTIHTKSTGSSYDRFTQLNLKYGDFINVTYTNDVMPYVSNCDCGHNIENNAEPEKFITVCPACLSELITSDSGKTVLCPNIECPGRAMQRMVNMFAKLNIKGFAEASFKALKRVHLYQLFELDKNYLEEKLGVVDGCKLYTELQQLRVNPINDYIAMGSLGFTSIAHKKWKSILKFITIRKLYQTYLSCKSYYEFETELSKAIPKIGEITLQTIVNEFQFFEKDIAEICKWNLIDSYGETENYLAQIRFTGVRNKQLSELLCNAGYDADDSSSAGKKTDILLVPYEGFESSKVKKVGENCKIIPIDEFINNMEKYIGEKLQ